MQFFPAQDDAIKCLDQNKPQNIWTKISSDLITPVAAMLKLKSKYKNCFLLESVEGGENKGRYSIIGLGAQFVWKCENGVAYLDGKKQSDDALVSLKKIIREVKQDQDDELPPMASGLFGYVGYDMVRLFENIPDSNDDELGIPDSVLFFPETVMIFDSVKDAVFVVSTILQSNNSVEDYQNAVDKINSVIELVNNGEVEAKETCESHEIEFSSNCTREEYHQRVEKAKEYIRAGDVFQLVPSQRFEAEFHYPPFAFYRSLRQLNPSPFLFYLQMEDFYIIGSSPEILVRLRDGKVTIRPIAGTRKRGKDEAEDKALMDDLLADKKELAEHLMLLDLGRNDVGRVAEGGKVEVTEQMNVELYSHVMHIVSNVEGKIAKGKDAVDSLAAGFPAGTVSGAPKIRAMEIIDELETTKRKFYAGAVGYFSGDEMDTCITLRTALIKDNKLYLQAGGGVVADSDPEDEYQETLNKAKALMKAAEMTKEFV